MKLGIDILLEEQKNLIGGKKIGVLANCASYRSSNERSIDSLLKNDSWKVAALFGPEHGTWLSAQDMEPVDSSKDDASGLPVFSLYGTTLESLEPTNEMLDPIDALVVDLQDVGSRYYTYVWTACLCARACAKSGKRLIICDRPNPIGGNIVEGGGVAPGFESFVGLHSLPNRHGMTIGEIVQFVNGSEGLECDIEIVRMDGWQREMHWPDTGLTWHNPSPNMRSYEAALLYPGMCLIEGTNLSEGRGTDEPFEIIGAPYIVSKELVHELGALGLPGILAIEESFKPTRQKWAHERCNGVRWKIEDAKGFQPYLTGLAFIWLVNKLYKDKGFEWRTAPYEFVTDKPAIDLLTGSAKFREGIDKLSFEDLKKFTEPNSTLLEKRKEALIY